jgi:hypothetical protein
MLKSSSKGTLLSELMSASARNVVGCPEAGVHIQHNRAATLHARRIRRIALKKSIVCLF